MTVTKKTMDHVPGEAKAAMHRQLQDALETLQKVWEKMPIGEDIELASGRKGRVTSFIPPEATHGDGIGVQAGFDVHFDDGHLEFMIDLSGWGAGPLKMPETPGN